MVLLVDGLMDEGYEVDLVNTAAVKQYDGIKFTYDRYDARRLAHLMQLGILPTGYIMPRERRAVRDLLRKRLRLVQQRTANILSLQNLKQRNEGVRLTVNDVRSLTPELVCHSEPDANRAMAMHTTLDVIMALDAQIDKLESALLKQLRPTADWKRLKTIWGVGPILAMTIQLETGPIERFATPGDYASYCRMVRTQRLSNGKSKGKGNEKCGNRYLCWAWIEAANFAVRYYEQARRFYERKKAKANTILARKALAHKLARAGWHVLRMKVEFPPIPDGDAGAVGDNLTNFEEYRGFVVRGAHRRTNPFFKDLFVEVDQFGGDILYAYPGLPIAVHRVEGTDLSSSGKINLNATGLPGSTSPWPNGHRDMQAQRVVRIDAPFDFPAAGRTLGQNTVNEPLVPNLAFDCEIFMDNLNQEKDYFGASDDDLIELRRSVVAHEVGHAVNLWHNLIPENVMFGGSFRKYQTFAIVPTAFVVNIPETYLTETTAGPELLEPIPARLLDPCQECGMSWDDNGQEIGSFGYPVYNFAETDTLRLKEQE